MSNWPDAKIRATALWYIGKKTMDLPMWKYTRVGDAHPEVLGHAELEPGELPIVSFFVGKESWYLLTTRRVVGAYSGLSVRVATLDVRVQDFGNFKGYRSVELEVMRLQLANDHEVALQYETGRASMAPIYYFIYWEIKYPVLDMLKDDPGA